MSATPFPRALAAPRDVTLGYKRRGSKAPVALSRSSRLRVLGTGRPGRRAAGSSAMFYSGLLTEGGRKETDMREAASLRQQRRMKQAVQFIHKDSADLLPLDGLKKLGSSKDTVSSPSPATPASGLRAAAVAQALGAAFTESPARPVTARSLAGARQRSPLSHIPGDLVAACSPSAYPSAGSPAFSSPVQGRKRPCPALLLSDLLSSRLFGISNLAPGAGTSQRSLSSHCLLTGCVASPVSQTEVTRSGGLRNSGQRGFVTVAESR